MTRVGTHLPIRPVRLIVVSPVSEQKNQVAETAAALLKWQVAAKPNSVCSFFTGGTAEAFCIKLIEMKEEGQIGLSQITAFALDEYFGLNIAFQKQSYRDFLDRYLFAPHNIPEEKIHMLDWRSSQYPILECSLYEKKIAEAGGIDFQLMGLGSNGHIAFCEPGTPWNTISHLRHLKLRTRIANSRFFMSPEEADTLGLAVKMVRKKDPHTLERQEVLELEDPFDKMGGWSAYQSHLFETTILPRVPIRAMTMGIKTIFQARKLLMLVNGATKATALRLALFEELTEERPAGVLRCHQDATVVADLPAVSEFPYPYNQIGEHQIAA